jgi:putative transposase
MKRSGLSRKKVEDGIIMRGFRYRLAPTHAQKAQFGQTAGVCRLIYNIALEQRRDWHDHFRRQMGHALRYTDQAKELTALRSEFEWIREVSSDCQQQALMDLEKAFSNFFAGRARHPQPRKKGINDAFRFPGRNTKNRRLNGKWGEVLLPKIGWVRFRCTREIPGTVKNVTIVYAAGQWDISFTCEIQHCAVPSQLPAVGIDRGVKVALALSTGEMFFLPPSISSIDKKCRSARRILVRRKRGSRRYLQQCSRLARLSAKAKRIRRDFHHRSALYIAERFGIAALESLKIKNMTASASGSVESPGRKVSQKRGLNRSILNQGWGGFDFLLSYKMEERGGRVVKVNPAYTSQTCSECGVVDARSRKSQAIFECIECGHTANADGNAAKNILRRWNTSHLCMEDPRRRPGEVRTGGRQLLPKIRANRGAEDVKGKATGP